MKIVYIVFAFLFSTLASATPLNNLVVFGDSLSDNGNFYEYMKHQLPVSPPYFEGRFTNGPVWVELLLKSYYPTNSKKHLLNYAFAGAGVMENDNDEDELFTLSREIDSYLLSHNGRADENSMYVVWIGSNNYLGVPENGEQMLMDVNKGIQHSLHRLVEKGAKHILVVNLPDLGRIPVAASFEAEELLSYLSKQHNTMLRASMSDFERLYPEVQWLYFDINVTFNDMMQHPERFGFSNVTDTCYEAMIPKTSKPSVLKLVASIHPKQHQNEIDACTGYLFFDPVHPSAAAHAMMAERTRKLFDLNGVTFK